MGDDPPGLPTQPLDAERHHVTDLQEDGPELPPHAGTGQRAWGHRPFAGADAAVVEGDLGGRQHQGHRVFRDLVDATGRVVGDDDAGFGHGCQIDGVDADAMAGDDLAPGHPPGETRTEPPP